MFAGSRSTGVIISWEVKRERDLTEKDDLSGVTWPGSADADSNYFFASPRLALNPPWFQRQLSSTLIRMPEDRGEAQERVEPMEEEDAVQGEAEGEGEAEVEAEVDDADEEEEVEVTEDEAVELAGLNR